MTILTFLLRGSLLPALAWLCLPLLNRAPAAARRLLLALSLAASLLVPFAPLLVPDESAARVSLPALHAAFIEPVSAGASSVAHVAARLSGLSERTMWSWESQVFYVWAFGATCVLASVLASRWRVFRLLQGAERISKDVVLSEAFPVPAVVGIWTGTVVLPHASLAWSDERRAAVMAHERAHLVQRDALAQLLAQLACAVYWNVPWVWWAARRLRAECELSADARVVASGVSAVSYADHLIAIARGLVDRVPQGAIGMASPLEQRIRALMSPPPKPWSRTRFTALFAGVAGVAAFVACATLTPHPVRASSRALSAGIDVRVQGIVDDEAARAKKEWVAEDVMVVVIDPRDGAVLARSGNTQASLVPGSTIKPFTVATALEAQRITLGESFRAEPRKYGKRTIRDGAEHGSLDLRQALAVSSNVSMSHVYDALGGESLLTGLRRLHFGEAPGVLPARLVDKSFEGAMVALGEGLRVTPEQLAAAYAMLVDGRYRVPSMVRGNSESEPVVSSEHASEVRTLLEGVVHGPGGTGKAAAVSGVRVAGKTGTSTLTDKQGREGTLASFAGLVPAQAPRFVIYVAVLAPRGGATGGAAAAPVFARIATRALRP